MALTVEELQIVLSCDATTAQQVLDKMDATVKAYTDKFQKYFQTNSGDVKPLDAVAKGVDKGVKDIESKISKLRKAMDLTPKSGTTGLDYKEIGAKIRSDKEDFLSKGYDPYANAAAEVDAIYQKTLDVESASASVANNMASWVPGGGGDALFSLADTISSRLQNSIGGVDSMPDTLRYKIDSVIETVHNLGEAYRNALETNGAEDKGTIALQKKFEAAVLEADRYINKLDQIAAKEQEVEEASSGAGEEPAKKFNLLASAFAAIKRNASGVVSSVSKAGASIKKAFSATLLGKFLKRLGTVMLRMAAMKLIRGTIQGVKEGLQELAKVSDSSAKAMNTISAAGGSIKMALGAAVMPIVKALAPVFISLASAINTACDAIARFFAVLSGQSSYTAVTFNKNMDSMTSSAGGGGSKAKGMLAAFDKINLISSQSGGGGGGGGVTSSMSTVGNDTPAVSHFAELFKQSWEKADFTFIGTLFSAKIAKALDDIDWNMVNSILGRVTSSLATFINGIFGNMKLADSIGSTLGQAFTSAYTAVSNFVAGINWSNIGKFITKSIQSFIKNWNVGSLTSFIANKLKAVFSFKAGLYKGIDWKNLPSLLKDKIVEAFKGFDFAGVASAIGDWLGAGCRAALDFLAGLVDLLSGMVQKIKDYFTEHIEDAKEAGGSVWDGILAGISEALSNIWNWVKDNIWTPFITAFKKAFGIASPAKNMIEPGNMIALGILEGIKNGLQRVGELFTAFKDIILGYLGIGLEYVRAFFATLIDFIATRGSLIKMNVERFVAQVKAFVLNGIADMVEKLASGPIGKLLSAIGIDLTGAVSSLRRSANEAAQRVDELDESIDSAQQKAKQGFDINAHVDHTKVDEYKKQISKGWSIVANVSADATALHNAIVNAMKVKMQLVFKVPGSGTKTGSMETKYIGLAMAQGGLAYGLTPAIIGEYAGASSNPEVVAPLSDLLGILTKANESSGSRDTMTKDQANTMIRLLQRIEQKENIIQPSVGLGQVVQRSLDAYGRI